MGKIIKYSIIVPVYNIEAYLEQCIESLINQTYENIEIILVNDGAIDECPQICNHYKSIDDRIVLINKINGGLVSARKAGAKCATGEYVVCVDGDDWMELNFIEKVNLIVQNYQPDVICCNYYESTGSLDKKITSSFATGLYNKTRIEKEIYPLLFMDRKGKSFPSSIWAKAYKRCCYLNEQLSVNDNISMGEDAACVKPLISRCNSLYIMPDYLYYYRQIPSSMTKIKKPSNWDGPYNRLIHFQTRVNLSTRDFQEQIDRMLFHALFNVIVSQFYKDEDTKLIIQDIKGQLRRKEYVKIINECSFSPFSKQYFALFMVKHRCYKFLKFIVKTKERLINN